MNVRKLIIISILLCVLTIAPRAIAQSLLEESARQSLRETEDMHGISLGQTTSLKLVVSQEVQYDTNIFLTEEDRKQDLLSITSPRLIFHMPFSDNRHLFQMMYLADIAAFSDYKSQNYVDQDMALKLNLNFPFGYFNLQNGFRDTVQRASTEFTDQVRRYENLGQAAFGVKMNKLSYEAAYAHFLRDYYEEQYDALVYGEDIFTGTVFYQVSPKIKPLLEYNHGIIDYTKDETRSGHYDQVRCGFKTDLTGKIDGVVKLGYQKRDYDIAGRKGYEGFVSQAGITADLSERTKLELNYFNTAVESISTNNNYFDLNSVILKVTQQIMNNVSLLLTSQLDRREYPEEDPDFHAERRDSVFTEGIMLRYTVLNRGRVSLGYQYKENVSNIDSEKYQDNIISLRFDFLI